MRSFPVYQRAIKVMSQSVLILAPHNDENAWAVRWALGHQGITTIWHPSLTTASSANHTLAIDADRQILISSMFGDADLKSVWYRQPADPAPVCLDVDRNFVSREWKCFQQNIFALSSSATSALWINSPHAARNAENKFLQLQACREVGLAFPEAIATNDIEQVKKFIKRWNRVIFKTFTGQIWRTKQSNSYYSAGVQVLDDISNLYAASIAICPGIYQRYVEKNSDIRVTVMGEHKFAIRLRNSKGAYIDWRPAIMSDEMIAEAIDLPSPLIGKIDALMSRLGLVFGCIDLVVGKDGEFYFLEINQCGEFLFFERFFPEFPMLQAISDFLSSGHIDFTLHKPREITLANYLKSDDFLKYKNAKINDTSDIQSAIAVE